MTAGGHRGGCGDLARTVLVAAERAIAQHARDGVLSLDDVRRSLLELAQSPDFEKVLRANERHCLHVAVPNGSRRRDPFRRLMVRPFEELLAGKLPLVPRAILGNFFRVMEQGLGQRLVEYDAQCRAVLQMLLVAHGPSMEWETFYSDPRSQRILAHALRRLLAFLDSPAGQWAWETVLAEPAADGTRLRAEGQAALRRILKDTWRGLELAHPVQED